MKRLLAIWFLVFVSLIFNLTGCGSNQGNPTVNSTPNPCPPSTTAMQDVITVPSLTGIVKMGLWQNCQPESSPVVLNDRLLMVTYTNGYLTPSGPGYSGVFVYDFLTKQFLGSQSGAGLYGSAFVTNNTLYYFSTSGDKGTKVIMTSTQDLHTWTPWVTVFTMPDQIFNTSVTTGPDGNFYMAFEQGLPNGAGYSFKIAKSPDLLNWTLIQPKFFSTEYSACPTIRYVNGAFQLMYLHAGQNFETWVAQTTDFVNYEIANTVLMAPSEGDGVNASDLDLAEFNGTTYLIYINGTQGGPNGWSGDMWATYPGTMSDMFTELWADGGYANPTPGN